MPPSFDYHDVCAFKNCIAHVYADFLNSAGILCMDVVFHLHGLKHAYCVAGIHGVAYAHLEIHRSEERRVGKECRL